MPERRALGKCRRIFGKPDQMKILFTVDLHLNIHASNPRSGRTAMEDFAEAIRWVGEKLPA